MASQFFEAFFRGMPEGQSILLWTVGDGSKISYWASSPTEADEIAERLSTTDHNLYFGVATRKKEHGPHGRGASTDTAMAYAMWIDIDIQSEAHSKQNLPADMDEAMSILEAVPLDPSILISTGHGIQAYWLLDNPLPCGPNYNKTKTFTKRFNDTFCAFAGKMGWSVDSVYDLARVMRVPGSYNIKNKAQIQNVTVINCDADRRYNIDDIDECIVDAPLGEPERVKAPASSQSVAVNDSAQPPFDKFEALRDNHPDFNDRWLHRRPPTSRDDSMSSYDMSLASIAAANGWTVQEIVDLLVSHRRKYAHLDTSSKANRSDYLVMTAEKALTSVKSESGILTSDELTRTITVTPEGPDMNDMVTAQSRDKVFQTVSQVLGIPCCDFIKYESEDDPTFRLKVKNRWIDLGLVENITNYRRFSDKIAAHVGKAVPALKPAAWKGLWEGLMAVARIEVLADGGDEAGAHYARLKRYLRSIPVVSVDSEIDVPEDKDEEEPTAYELPSGALIFALDGFHTYLRLHARENVMRKSLAKSLRIKGVIPKSLQIRKTVGEGRTRRNMWVMKEV